MNLAIDVLLHAGRSAVDVALYTLLPIMVLMMIVMPTHSRLVSPCASSLTLLSPKLRSEDCGAYSTPQISLFVRQTSRP
jgi:sorbitol-specific phosphotransferase system component IIBC